MNIVRQPWLRPWTGEPKRTWAMPPLHWVAQREPYDATLLPPLPLIDPNTMNQIAANPVRRQHLAQVGDSALHYASMRCLTRAGLQGQLHTPLQKLNTNNLFAYLALTYGLSERLPWPGFRSPRVPQKTSADMFEAYIGALWLEAVERWSKQGEDAVLHWLAVFYGDHVWPRIRVWNEQSRRSAWGFGPRVLTAIVDEYEEGEWTDEIRVGTAVEVFSSLRTADEPLCIEEKWSPAQQMHESYSDWDRERVFDVDHESQGQVDSPDPSQEATPASALPIDLLSTVSRQPRLPRTIAYAPSPEPELVRHAHDPQVIAEQHCSITEQTTTPSNVNYSAFPQGDPCILRFPGNVRPSGVFGRPVEKRVKMHALPRKPGAFHAPPVNARNMARWFEQNEQAIRAVMESLKVATARTRLLARAAQSSAPYNR